MYDTATAYTAVRVPQPSDVHGDFHDTKRYTMTVDIVNRLVSVTTFLDQYPTFKARDEALHGDPMKPSTSSGTKRSPRKNGLLPKVWRHKSKCPHSNAVLGHAERDVLVAQAQVRSG